MFADHGYEVAVAVVGAIPVIVGSVLAYKAAIRKQQVEHENKNLKKEMNLVSTSLSSFGGMLAEFSQVEREIQELCANSEVTRVMLLCAWNGKYSPKWTTAVWQYRTDFDKDGSINRPVGYVHLGLDSDYVERLLQIKRSGSVTFKTEDAPTSLIKTIYEAEEVTESLWVFLSSSETEIGEGKLMTYMSFSAQGGAICAATQLKCRLLAARLAPLTGQLENDD